MMYPLVRELADDGIPVTASFTALNDAGVLTFMPS